ncbi:MAG: PorV/PorQ family protein [Ignavibacteriales bacterium]|nr:PorV/PorQ family protein [Ignavibacteriales bacterium]
MIKKIIALALLLSSLSSSQTKVGSTAAPFLNIGMGPRAISMGGAFVATANDLSTLYWNPAGASRMEATGAMFLYSPWFADITYNWAGLLVNTGSYGSLGLSVTYLDYGKMEVTTLSEQEGTGEYFSAKDIAFSVTYSYNLTDKFSLGMNVKYINQKIWNSSADAFAIDLGTLFISDFYGVRIGASISNFGTDMTLDGKDLLVLYDPNPNLNGNNDQILTRLKTDAYPLPLIFRVGIAKDFFVGSKNRITVAADAIHPNDNAEAMNVGTEYSFNENLFIRAGYKSLFLTNTEEGLNLGFGLKYEIADKVFFNIDYAYQDFGKLKYTQQFGVGIQF